MGFGWIALIENRVIQRIGFLMDFACGLLKASESWKDHFRVSIRSPHSGCLGFRPGMSQRHLSPIVAAQIGQDRTHCLDLSGSKRETRWSSQPRAMGQGLYHVRDDKSNLVDRGAPLE
jgi:hypothetical protein